MSCIKSFPFEVIAMILKEIDLEDRDTAIHCLLTCKLWNRLLNKRIYHCVDLCNRRHYRGRFARRIIRDPSIGEMVNEIRFDSWTDDFDLYVIYCPNLGSIFCKCGNTKYLEKLRNKLKSGAWKQMDSIQHPGIFMSDYKVYAELAWMLRDRLTELFICGESFFSSSKQPVDAIIRTNNDQLVESLASFRKLESVDIELDGKHIYEFDKYIDACPPSSLEIVKITSYVSPQVLLNDSDFQKRAMPQRNDLSKIKQWPQVKQLSVTIPIANDDSLLYLMQKFPSLLEFELNANTENQLGYVNRQFAANLSRQTLDSFYLYLSSISNCFIEKFYGKLVLQSSAAIK